MEDSNSKALVAVAVYYTSGSSSSSLFASLSSSSTVCFPPLPPLPMVFSLKPRGLDS